MDRAWHHNEPLLLVGESGGGKTTVVHLLSSLLAKGGLDIIKLHINSKAFDVLGGLGKNDQKYRLTGWQCNTCMLASLPSNQTYGRV